MVDTTCSRSVIEFSLAKTPVFKMHFMPRDSSGGLGPAGASGLLALLFPARFGTVDQFVVGALRRVRCLPERDQLERMKPESLTIAHGVVLIEIMRRKAVSLNELFNTSGWTPRKIDKILWAQRV